MLVDELLLAFGVQHHGEAVKASHDAVELKAVHQKHGDGEPVLPGLVEKSVLKILGFLHDICSFVCKFSAFADNLS